MQLAPNVFDVWAFRRAGRDTRFEDGETITQAIARELNRFNPASELCLFP